MEYISPFFITITKYLRQTNFIVWKVQGHGNSIGWALLRASWLISSQLQEHVQGGEIILPDRKLERLSTVPSESTPSTDPRTSHFAPLTKGPTSQHHREPLGSKLKPKLGEKLVPAVLLSTSLVL